MVHNRTMGFPCNFDWWRQQQTAFFQMNFSREFNTHYMASSPRGEIPNFVSASLAILYVSICFRVQVYQLKREYLFHALKPANWKLPVGTFGVLLLCKQGAGFQPRLQLSPLFCIVLSANQV